MRWFTSFLCTKPSKFTVYFTFAGNLTQPRQVTFHMPGSCCGQWPRSRRAQLSTTPWPLQEGTFRRLGQSFLFLLSYLYFFLEVLRCDWPFPARIVLWCCQPFPEKECFLEKIGPVEKSWGQAVSHLEGTLRHSVLLESPRILEGTAGGQHTWVEKPSSYPQA